MNPQQLQDKIRRSSTFLDPQKIFNLYMQYAEEVKDQQQVYQYMEENKIGINNPKYWLARFEVLEQQCQYVRIVQVLSKIKKNLELLKHPNYCLIQTYEYKLSNRLQAQYKSKFPGKRSINFYQKQLRDHVGKRMRKIGQIEIYVDHQCRRNYMLEDYAQAIQKQFPQIKNYGLQNYQRKQAKKYSSFITKKQKHLNKMAEQLFISNKNYQKQQIQVRKSNKVNLPQPETPKDKCRPFINKQLPYQDSIEILKKNFLKNQSPRFKSLDLSNQEISINTQTIQYCRFPTEKIQDFSFGGDEKSNIIDDARIEQNQNQTQTIQDSFNLGLVIIQAQTSKYQTQTFESINSNQQNEDQNIFEPSKRHSNRICLAELKKQKFDNQESLTLEELLNKQENLQMQYLRPTKSSQKNYCFSQKALRHSHLQTVSQQKSYSLSQNKIQSNDKLY